MGYLKNEGDMIEIHNAGLMLLSPFCTMLFFRLDYLREDRRVFKDRETQYRGIFLLQYLVYGEEKEWEEEELFLNRIFVNLINKEPLPRSVKLLNEEIEMVDRLIEQVCDVWEKMRKVSKQGFRDTFLLRDGLVSSAVRNNRWTVRVEERDYDVLLDSVPWGFRLYKGSWMPDMIETKWKS